MNKYQLLADLFEKALTEKGISLEKLAALSGLSLDQVRRARVEGLHRIPLDEVSRILRHLNLSAGEIQDFANILCYTPASAKRSG